jgi:hypothetical protein
LSQKFELLFERQQSVGITLRCATHRMGNTQCLLLQFTSRFTQGDGDLTFVFARTVTVD